ncbi:MAG: host attachment protein [Verrucomicrobiota bacterium]
MADKLIVLADLGRMKAFRVTRDEMSKTPKLDVVGEFDNADSHVRLVDKVSDKAGRFPGTNGSGAMSNGENHNLKSESERRSIKQLSESINRLVEKEAPTLWYFAASKEINQKIVEELSSGVRSKLKKIVTADLTKVTKAELLTHF